MSALLELLFGCRHRRKTFPLTKSNDTYVVCLDCGKEFVYDWREMRVGVVRDINKSSVAKMEALQEFPT